MPPANEPAGGIPPLQPVDTAEAGAWASGPHAAFVDTFK